MSDTSERRAQRERPGPTKGTVLSDLQPRVVIVGFPNVGKSTLFNRLTGRRDAVVDAVAGVTRDRRQSAFEWRGRAFQIIDTGGVDEIDPTPISRKIAEQALSSLDDADLVLMVLDTHAGIGPGDAELIERVRRSHAPTIVVANKCEREPDDVAAQAFWGVGLGDVIPVSAQHGRGIGELLDAIVEALPGAPEAESLGDPIPAICILGRPNVGKSSILNALLGEERVIVHDRPGTTRDPIDTLIEVEGRQVVLIDTAGIRKRGRTREALEHYSQIRAIQAAERSDVALVVCSAAEGLTDNDLSAADKAAHAHCSSVLVMNKWDLAQPEIDDLRGKARAKTRQRPPIEVCSTVTGEGLLRLLPTALRLYDRAQIRHSTNVLNTFLRALALERPGPKKDNRRLSLRYLVQTGVNPPTFRLEVNDRSLMTRDYGFWIENRLRQHLDLDGIPVEIEVRGRQ
jgi:GTPase